MQSTNLSKSTKLFAAVLALCGASAVVAQSQSTEGPGVQAAADARETAVLAGCQHAPPPRPNRANFPRPAAPSAHYRVPEIPGVIAAGQHWKLIWRTKGNNADGIMGTPDGGILIAQNSNSDVVKLTLRGHASILYQDTDTGGALSLNKQGQLFINERGLNASIWELSPQHRVLANRYGRDSFDCIGGVLNDLTAAANGGVYFTQGGPPAGGLFYAAPDGTVTHYGDNLRTNGIILSPDEKTLYVTNAGTLVAFDVQANGALTNQRVLATLPGGGGDGSTIDAQGRIYVTGFPGVRVVSPDGNVLGTIPAPIQLISVAFSGPDKKTLFAVGELRNTKPGTAGVAGAEILAIPMLADGYGGRAK